MAKKSTRKKSTKSKSKGNFNSLVASVISGILFISTALFLLITIVTSSRPNGDLQIETATGKGGDFIATLLHGYFGYFSLFIPILLLLWGFALILKWNTVRTIFNTFKITVFWVLLSALLGLHSLAWLTGSIGFRIRQELDIMLGDFGAWLFSIAFFLIYLWLTVGVEKVVPLIMQVRNANEDRRLRKEEEAAKKREQLLKEYEQKAKDRQKMLGKINKVGSLKPGHKAKEEIIENPIESPIETPIESPIENHSEVEEKPAKRKIQIDSPPEPKKSDDKYGAISIDIDKVLARRNQKSGKQETVISEGTNDNAVNIQKEQKPAQTPVQKIESKPIEKAEPPKETKSYSDVIDDPVDEIIKDPIDTKENDTTVTIDYSEMESRQRSYENNDEPIHSNNTVDDDDFEDGDVVSSGLKKAREIAQNVSIKPDEKNVEFVSEEIKEETEHVAQDERRIYFYQQPSVNLMDEPEQWGFDVDEAKVEEQSELLEQTLEHFKITGEITRVTPGPVITRFEYRPERGIKVSKISSLSDDLAMALKATAIRIIAPIPGKDVVGIEVPNDDRKTVYIKEILLSEEFRNTKAKLPIALGSGVDGRPVIADLAKAPHLLIAGATGSGKSVCVNTIITSLLYSHTPKTLRVLMIDPKRLELSLYNDIPFLLAPVVVEPKDSAEAFKWAVEEMTTRYKMLAEIGVRNLADFNERVRNNQDLEMDPLPRIVLIVDELADLMMTVSNQIEEPIARIAQMARAVGMHLILATQRPSVDVITGLIKANFPSRIAFKVRSQIDSRTIIDMGGAERLLGYGDMLFLNSTLAEPMRVHGSFVSTEESERLVKDLKKYINPFETEDFSVPDEVGGFAGEMEFDEYLVPAARTVVNNQKGSASMLQRKMRIGYNRAGSIIDQLERLGIVGPPRGSKPREVIVKEIEILEEVLQNRGLL